MKHIGFTGTRHGMTEAQRGAIAAEMVRLQHAGNVQGLSFGVWHSLLNAHHGDCVGADAEFHAVAISLKMRTVGHLPVDDSHRAFCSFAETRTPLTHMARNRAIVAESDVMLACPYEPTEQPRGGTWATIRMARKASKPLAIVMPDGTVQYERWEGVS